MIKLEKPGALFSQAQDAFDRRDWTVAIELLMQIISVEPEYPGAQRLLRKAQKRRDAHLIEYKIGLSYFDDEKWAQAIKRFRAALRDDPSHVDAQAKLEKAKRKAKIARLLSKANRYSQHSRWGRVVTILNEALKLDPGSEEIRRKLAEALAQPGGQRQPPPDRYGNIVRRWGPPLLFIVLGVVLLRVFGPRLAMEARRRLGFVSLVVTSDCLGVVLGAFALIASIIGLLVPPETIFGLLKNNKRVRYCVILAVFLLVACLLILVCMVLMREVVFPEIPTPTSTSTYTITPPLDVTLPTSTIPSMVTDTPTPSPTPTPTATGTPTATIPVRSPTPRYVRTPTPRPTPTQPPTQIPPTSTQKSKPPTLTPTWTPEKPTKPTGPEPP